MKFVESLIHPLVKSHFPQFYVEEGPRFIDFVREYYRWLEQTDNAIQVSRNLQSLRDVDSTTDALFIHFKEKYLKGLPITTEANKQLFLKYITNLYNAKGTERGIQMLIRAMFNESSEIFYPGDKLFKSSAGVWFIPKYLELNISTRTLDYIGKEIVGNISGAKAFVEKLTIQRINGNYFNVAYLSNIRGSFITGEYVTESSNTVLLNAPEVIGSLTSLEVITGGQDFRVGDVFDVESTFGERAKARVTGLSNQTGIVSFSLIDGGWGYTNTANVLISSKVITIANTTNANTLITGFSQFETFSQNLRSLSFTSSSNSSLFTVGSLVENYDGGGAIIANATIVTLTTSNTTAGTLVIAPITGAINTDATFSLSGNATTGVISSFIDVSASGNVIAQNTTGVGVIDVLNTFLVSNHASVRGVTSNTSARVLDVSTGSQANFAVSTLSNIETTLLSPDFLSSNNTANVVFYTINLNGNNAGFANSSYGFPNYPAGNVNAILYDVLRFQTFTLGTIASIKDINPGTSYNIDPFVVVLQKNVWGYDKHDFLIEYTGATGAFSVNENISASFNKPATTLTVTGFSGTAANGTPTTTVITGEFLYQSNGSANIATGFVDSSSIVGGNGTIVAVETTGTFINTSNSTLVLRSLTTGGTANITLVQSTPIAVVARGIVKQASNSTCLSVKRISMADLFTANQVIIGQTTGVSANIVSVAPESLTRVVGINADIEANVQTSNNAVTNLVVVDSGFGYINDEIVNLTNQNTSFVVSAVTSLGKHGVGTGFFTSANGFVSDDNKLQDGEYYQDFSYEVQTKIPFNKYFDVLQQVMHLAGTKAFGRVISVSDVDLEMEIPTDFRSAELTLVSGSNVRFTNGEVINCGSFSETLLKDQITYVVIPTANVPFIVGNTAWTPNASVNVASGIISGLSLNATATVVYLANVYGTFDGANTITSSINSTATNSYSFTSALNIIVVSNTSGQINTNSIINGLTSSKTANVTYVTIQTGF